jgi:predicted metal-dependent phosphoesterase TrpH
VRIDLHTHSRVSDGSDEPADVVRRAAVAGLDVLALTDHDTAASWPEAVAAAEQEGLTLVRGMEVSTRLEGSSVHLLAYLPDATYPPLAEALERILDGRNQRVPAICAKLQALGIDVDVADVRRVSEDAAATGRPHVADAMIVAGAVASREEAFDRYLGSGGPAYVERYAAPLREMVGIVADAGGVSVLAHPWGRASRDVLIPEVLAELAGLGLAGLEVDHLDHDTGTRDRLRGIAGELGLLVTGSSDYHGTGKAGHGLGVETTAPEQYERLVAIASEAARTSGRHAPGVLGP